MARSALMAALLLSPAGALAQDEVHLFEVVPALEGTDLGALSLGPAPAPGAVRVVRRSEVLAALSRAGREARGLSIPRQTTIRRREQALSSEDVARLSRAALTEALSPCEVRDVTVQHGASLAEGDVHVEVDAARPERSGTARVLLRLRVDQRELRVPAQATVVCPPPIVQSGQSLTLVARFGAVEARAPGVARQPGRTGDVIRVSNSATRASLRARVIDPHTAEVVP